jgi:membrane associated rhomboid family serine protease
MIFLGVFGATVEDRLGRLVFLGFYLLGGLAALALQVLVAPASATPTLGASGAVAAVLGAYIVLYPRAKIRTLVDATLGILGLSTPLGGGAGIGYYAQWGGFAFGLLVGLALVGHQRTPARGRRQSA